MYEFKTYFIIIIIKNFSHLNVYVIHYTKLVERKVAVQDLFKDKFFKVKFITNFDKEEIYNFELEKYYLDDPNTYVNKSKLWKKDIHYRRLNDAEISCTLKHIEALKITAESDSAYSLIVEDDVLPKKYYISKLKRIIKNNHDWDILFIGQGISKNFILKKINKRQWFGYKAYEVKHPASNCAEAYLIKSEVAKKVYENILPFTLISDWELAYQFYKLDLNVKWLYPPIFFQGSKSGKYKSELREE
tara:strand:- start:13037 stop:13774 length:738 start_codon:yes stop_codon:yes gene_type:complete